MIYGSSEQTNQKRMHRILFCYLGDKTSGSKTPIPLTTSTPFPHVTGRTTEQTQLHTDASAYQYTVAVNSSLVHELIPYFLSELHPDLNFSPAEVEQN